MKSLIKDNNCRLKNFSGKQEKLFSATRDFGIVLLNSLLEKCV